MGGVYGPTGRLDEAQASLEKGLALPPGPGQAIFRVMALVNLGNIAWHRGQTEAARARFKEAYRRAGRAGLLGHAATAGVNLLALLYEQNDYAGAMRVGRRTLAMTEALALRSRRQQTLSSLCLVRLALGRLAEAEEAAHALREEALASREDYWAGLAEEALMNAALQRNHYAAALAHRGSALERFRRLGQERLAAFVTYECLKAWDALGYARGIREEIVSWGGLDPLAAAGRRHNLPSGLFLILGVDHGAAAQDLDASLIRWRRSGSGRPLLPAPVERTAHDLKVHMAFLRASSGASVSNREIELLLRRSPGGPWGLRLYGLLYAKALASGARSRARGVRRRALWHLYDCRAHSPEEVWRRVMAFPELRALLVGQPADAGPRRGGKSARGGAVRRPPAKRRGGRPVAARPGKPRRGA